VSAGALDLYARADREAVPLTVTVELTRRCTYRCRHCYVPDLGSPDELPTERLLALLRELADAGTLFLAFTGGEPLLRRDWPAIARRARELGFAVEFLTNAALVDDAAARTLAQLHALASVSLHSMDPAVFEAVTGVPGSLALTLAGVKRLRAHGVEVLLKVPLSTLNRGAADAVHAYAGTIGAACEAYTVITSRSDGDATPLALRLPAELVEEHYRRPWARCPRPEAGLEVRDDEPLCAAGTRAAHVTATGDVLACIDLPTPAGNLLERSFAEIWQASPWLARLRVIRRGDLRVCGECAKLAYCGRCHARALVEDGDLLGPSSWACDHALTLERLAAGRRDP
jgi:radical SAM protein with 4Fe4S-binding SPASM domain